jgi:hypothetical protein
MSAVPDANFDVAVPLPLQPLNRPLPQLIDDFDAVYFAGQLGEHCSLVTKAGANFEDNVVGLELKQVRHHRNHQRLRDSLIEANRKRPVKVGILLNLDRDKLVPRDFGYCLENSIVQLAFADLGADVVSNCPDCSNHLSSLFLEIVDAHERPHCLEAYHPTRMTAIADLDAPLAVTQSSHRRRRPKYLAY